MPERAFAPVFFPTGKNVKRREQRRHVETVDDVVWLDAVPEAHQSEGQKVSQDCSRMHAFEPFAARSGEQETHVNVVAKPERKRDMPAIPEIANVSGEEGPVEVFRSVNAKQITDADGKSAISGEIEEQIKAVGYM